MAQKEVLIGGTGGKFADLAKSSIVQHLLANDKIGLYMHANGMAALSSNERSELWKAWAPTGLTPTGQGDAVGEVGGFDPPDAGYLSFFGGAYPDRVNMNVLTNSGDGTGVYTAQSGDINPGTVYTGFTTSKDLLTMKSAIDAAKKAGAKTVAVFMTPNGGGEDLNDSFANSGYWANVRAAALYGGGLALDVPPSYWLARGEAYQNLVRQMLTWASQVGIRTSMTVSPYALVPDQSGNVGANGYDNEFFKNTRALVADIRKASLPTEWVVENYSPGGTMNDVGQAGATGTLNEVALWLAQNATLSEFLQTQQASTISLTNSPVADQISVNLSSTATQYENVKGRGTDKVSQQIHLRPEAADVQSESYKSDIRPEIAFSNGTTGQGGVTKLDYVDAGAPDFLKWSYIMSGRDNVALASATPNVFIHGGSGNDAIAVQSGNNVLDGGSGSNYLYGGTGNDTFFTDLRPEEVTWSTLVNFHQGDRATIWGYKDGISRTSWRFYDAEKGKNGVSGATLDVNVDGGTGRNGSGVDASITFAGLSVAQAAAMIHSRGSSPNDGGYLSFYNQGV